MLADVVLSSSDFNFSATLVNSQLVCLLPVGIVFIGPEKPQWGVADNVSIFLSFCTACSLNRRWSTNLRDMILTTSSPDGIDQSYQDK